MIPFLAVVNIRKHPRRRFDLWIPLIPVWLLLLPLILVLSPLVLVACLASRVSPLRALSVFWQTLTSTSGTDIAVEHSSTSLSIRII